MQRHFVDAYINKPDEQASAICAGYHHNAKPLSNPRVLEEVRQRQSERAARTDIDSEWMLKRLALELEADLADLYDPQSGDILPIHQWPLIWRQGLVISIDTLESASLHTQITKIKQSDRTKRLELIGKHVSVNAFKEQIDVTTTINVNINAVDQLTEYLEQISKPSPLTIEHRSPSTRDAE